MSRYAFALADLADDAALRERMAADWMRGTLSVSFRREPSYFAGCALQGERAQVIKCVDTTDGRLVGMGCRSLGRVWLNGQQVRVGYLSDLRGAPEVRRGTLLARGYRLLQQLHEADPLPLYYTMILDGNEAALSALTGSRAGLPTYSDLGRMLTPALHLDLPRRRRRLPALRCRRAGEADLGRLTAFLQQRHASRQFAPVWDVERLMAPGAGRLRLGDFWLAERGDDLVATLAAWDQHAVRQTHIEAYSPGLALLRPFWNLLATVSPLKPLPAVGARVPYLYFSALAAADDDPDLLRALFEQVYQSLRQGPWHYAIAGLHERDPLAVVLADFRQIKAAGRLFAVHYADGADAFAALDGRVPYVDMGTI
ncbi:hypothetical protein [Parachitinimonas caeni]|uniref:GNAT family N-acetyltransferase n=1 Tax=Parachitinimonas caeni TaxID=3031301 RepID=A0ABT7E4I6_9NEIS|nr:hypothetical protein [Parachitinimonas caeni]MDK2125817.1 hypothetical protein [Parachitinimonas caeni]